jgi:hypothetical protein
MKTKKSFQLSLVACLLLFACGGGGDSGSSSPAVLSPSNASQASDAAIQAARLVSPAIALGEINAASSTNNTVKRPLLIGLVEEAVSVAKAQSTKSDRLSQGTLPATSVACSGGGNITVSATWLGPDNPSSPSQVVNFNANMTFNSCIEGALDAPITITLSVPSLSFADTYSGDNFSMTNFTMVFTGMQWNGNELTGGTVTISGAISGTLDNSTASFASNDLTLTFDMTSNAVNVSISGRVKASCLSDWVTITTYSPIVFPFTSSCPTAGEIVVTDGANSVKIEIAASSTITVYFNNDLIETYTNCFEIEGLCTS